jgi:hypothetical protein
MTTPTGPGITTPVTTPSYFGSVRQQNPVGQNLSPNPNVYAPVYGYGGDKWGANGGDQNPIGGGATDQTGYLKPTAITPCSAETATNFQDQLPLGTANRPTPATRLGQQNTDALSGQTQEPLTSTGNNAG